MNLNKIVNEINGTVKKSKIRTCGYFGQTKVEQLRKYPEIHLENLFLALNKKGIEFEFNDEGKLITYYTGINREIKVGCIFLDLETTLSKQKPEVTKKLIEILS